MQANNALEALISQTIQATDHLSPSPYAISIAALVPGVQQPACIRWLLENYLPAREHSILWQDSYICSYAAALALRNAGHISASDTLLAELSDCVRDAAQPETLTFGGLVGALDRYAKRHFDMIPNHPGRVRDVVADEARKWDKLIRWEGFYDPTRSIAGYAGECIYDQAIDLNRFIAAFSAPNGSIASSPSASAMTVLSCMDQGLTGSAELQGYVWGLDPYRRTVGELDQVLHFNTAWTLMYAGEALRTHVRNLPEVRALREALYGTSLSPLICPIGATTVPGELDTGSAAMMALGCPTAERQKLFERVEHMFDNSRYRTFLFERNASVTTNIHILGAWPGNPHLHEILVWLSQELRQPVAEWVCKWHLSPYYVASEVARLLADVPHPIAQQLVRHARQFLITTQQFDGGWGVNCSTTEETAYAVLGILAGTNHKQQIKKEAARQLARARAFLHNPPDYEKLWIGKSLYCVRPLVRALQQMALAQLG